MANKKKVIEIPKITIDATDLPKPVCGWGSINVICKADEVDHIKKILTDNHYCYELSKNPETQIHTFKVFIIANITIGKVEPA